MGSISWNLSQIKHWAASHMDLCHYCPTIFFRQRQGFCVWVGVYISALVAWRIPFKDARTLVWKFHIDNSSTSPWSVSCVDDVFSSGAFLSICGKQPWQQPRLLGICMGPFQATTQLHEVLEASSSVRRWPVGFPSPSLFRDVIKITFINYRKFSLHYIST